MTRSRPPRSTPWPGTPSSSSGPTATIPLTLPSHVSILTGELPPVHKVRDNAGYPFESAKHPYLPRLLKQAGYETGAAISAFVLRPDTGLADGFDLYDGELRPELGDTIDSVQRPGGETLQAALPWIRERAGRPFFFFLHLYEPHAPYEAPEPFASRYPDPYDGEVAAADAVVGDLVAELKRLGIYDRATVVLLSDHGEGLGDHGEGQHGIFLYRETLQVPLLVKLPGGKRGGERIAAPAQLADVTPTLLSLAGLEVPRELPGLFSPGPSGDAPAALRRDRLSADPLRLERPRLADRGPLPLHRGAGAGAVRPGRRSG